MYNFTDFEIKTIEKGWKSYNKLIKANKTPIKEIRVCLYLRKSTEDIKDNSLKLQKDEINKFINNINQTYLNEYKFYYNENDVFSEDNVSGMQGRMRPEFNKMLSFIENNPGYYGVCFVYKLDRFSRKLEDTLNYISLLKSFKCVLKALDFEDNGDPTSDLLRNMLGIVAQYHAQNSALTSIKGTIKKVEENKAVGLLPMGLIQEKKINNNINKKGASNIIIDESKAVIIRKIYNMFANGISIGNIENYLQKCGYKNNQGNIITRQQIKYILKNKRYNGTYIYADPEKHKKRKYDNGVSKPEYYYKKDAFPKIIEDELFDKVQLILLNNNSQHLSSEYLLSNYIICGCCGMKLHGWSRPKYKNKRYFDYVCKTHKNNINLCPTKRINKLYVEKIVLKLIIEIIKSISNSSSINIKKVINDKLEILTNEINHIEEQIIIKNNKINKVIDRMMIDQKRTKIYEDKLNEIEEEIIYLKDKLNENKYKYNKISNILINKERDFIIDEETLIKNQVLTKTLIKMMFEEIIITNENIIIKIKKHIS